MYIYYSKRNDISQERFVESTFKMPKRQHTLAAFGFTKKVIHNNKLVEVKLPKAVDEEKTLPFQCSFCKNFFAQKKGVVVHEKFCKENASEMK